MFWAHSADVCTLKFGSTISNFNKNNNYNIWYLNRCVSRQINFLNMWIPSVVILKCLCNEALDNCTFLCPGTTNHIQNICNQFLEKSHLVF